MSTRGFIGFAANGELKVTYNHSDSYPSHLGERMLSWALRATAPAEIEVTRAAVTALRVVAIDSTPTPEQIEELKTYVETRYNRGRMDDWCVLLHATQGDPAATLAAGYILDGSEFPADSLFAEWGYVVDLDAQTFEVYRGFVQTGAEGRFADMDPVHPDYGPVTLLASFPLSALPEELDDAALGLEVEA